MAESFQKQPFEKYPIAMEYNDPESIPPGTTVSACTVTGYRVGTGVEDNTVLVNQAATIDGGAQTATVVVQDGVHQIDYKLEFDMTLDDGSKVQDEVVMQVRDT